MMVGPAGGHFDFGKVVPHQLHQLIVDDLHDHLARRHRGDHIPPKRFFLHVIHELPGYLEVHIGIKQCAADFAQCLGYILFG